MNVTVMIVYNYVDNIFFISAIAFPGLRPYNHKREWLCYHIMLYCHHITSPVAINYGYGVITRNSGPWSMEPLKIGKYLTHVSSE